MYGNVVLAQHLNQLSSAANRATPLRLVAGSSFMFYQITRCCLTCSTV